MKRFLIVALSLLAPLSFCEPSRATSAGNAISLMSFMGTSALVSTSKKIAGPQTFTLSLWFRTGTIQGGRLIGFGSEETAASANYDRMLYMDNAGKIIFGVYDTNVRPIQSPGSYNDGAWHHVAASLSCGDGMKLYMDGALVASNPSVTSAIAYDGYWRIGWDKLNNWPFLPSSFSFDGQIDEAQVWKGARTEKEIFRDMNYSLDGREAGLGLYYRFDEGFGSDVMDSSGSENHGSAGASANWASSDAPVYINSALVLDGINDYATISHLVSNPQTFSLGLWFRTTTTQGGRLIGFSSDLTGSSLHYDRMIYMNNSGQLLFGVHSSGPRVVTSPMAYNDGYWHHAGATFSPGSGMRLYLDGALVASDAAVSSAFVYNGYWRAGWDSLLFWPQRPSSDAFAGTIDEVQAWDDLRTGEQIALTRDSRFAETETGLVSYLRFDEGAGLTASDSSGQGHDAVLYNGPQWADTTLFLNTPPVFLRAAQDWRLLENTEITLPHPINDGETPPGSLIVSSSSSNPALLPAGGLIWSGVGAGLSLRIVPAASQSGSSVVTITVSDGSLSNSQSFRLTVEPATPQAEIWGPSDLTVDEGVPLDVQFVINYERLDQLAVAATSSNPLLIPNDQIELIRTGSDLILRLPALDVAGSLSSLITIRAHDGVRETVKEFNLTVLSINRPPGTSLNLPGYEIGENTRWEVPFFVNDSDGAAGVVVTATSSDPDLIPNQNLVFGATTYTSADGKTTAGVMTITPLPFQHGPVTITVTATDGELSTSQNYDLFVLNDPNTLALPQLASHVTDEDTTVSFNFAVHGVNRDAQLNQLIWEWSSTNGALLDLDSFAVAGAGLSRSVTITPHANQHGTATITLRVVSDGGVVSSSFFLTVRGVNDIPTISQIPEQKVNEDAVVSIPFTVNDVETPADSLNVTYTMLSTAGLFPTEQRILKGSGSNRILELTPAPNKSGRAEGRIFVSDGTSTSSSDFKVEVVAVEDFPEIAGVPESLEMRIGIVERNSSSIAITVTDAETSPAALTVAMVSNNSTLLPAGSLGVQGTGRSRSLIVSPPTGKSGQATITVRVTDGAGAITRRTIALNVIETPFDSFIKFLRWKLYGSLADGYISGATVFFDANKNGVQDPGEPGSITTPQGLFDLDVPLDPFDKDGNGEIDPSEGRLVALGGLDIATGKVQTAPLTAPVGASVISPITTLVESVLAQSPGLSLGQAEAQVEAALGLSAELSERVHLLEFDPLSAGMGGDADAGIVQAASAKVIDSIVQISALLYGMSPATPGQIAGKIVEAMAEQVLASGALNLSQSSAVREVVAQAAAKVSASVSVSILDGGAAVIADVNQAKDLAAAAAATPQDALEAITKVQVVAQIQIADSLRLVGSGQQSVEQTTTDYSGASLALAIESAPIGDLTGFDNRPGLILFDRASYQVQENGRAAYPAKLVRFGGTRGEIAASVSLSDATATQDNGDYTGGTIDVQFADGEISKTIDLSSHLHPDGLIEGDETLQLSVALRDGSVEGARLGSQTTAILTIIDSDSPGTFAFGAAAYEVEENGSGTANITVTRQGGAAGQIVVIVTPNSGTATAASDFASPGIEVVFPAGATTRLVPVPIMKDSLIEGNEDFTLTLSLAAGSPATTALGERTVANVTILDTPNSPPTATARTLITAEDSPVVFVLTGQDLDGDSLTFTVVSSPTHGALSGTPPNLIYTPSPDFHGQDVLTFRVSDGQAEPAEAAVSITVNSVNDSPYLASPLTPQTGIYGSEFRLMIPAGTFLDVDVGQLLSYAADGLPPGISFDPITAVFSGRALSAGNYPVAVTVADNGSPPRSIEAILFINVSKAALTVTAGSRTKVYGAGLPEFTASFDGFVNGDSESSLDVPVTLSTTATALSGVGIYPIEARGAADGNYGITFQDGTLTVSNVAPVVNAGLDQEKVAGDEVTFAGAFTDPSSPGHEALWGFDDGSPEVAGTLTPTHVFTRHGVYNVTLTVSDSHGAAASDSLVVTIISAYGCASNAWARLTPFIQESKRIEKAVKDLRDSLDPKFWMDEMHLSAKGRLAFVDWRKAADMMEQFFKPLNKRQGNAQDVDDGEDDDEFKKIFNAPKSDALSVDAIATIRSALPDVICAARLISETLYLENEALQALDPRRQKRVDTALARAKEYLADANALAEKADFGNAVRRYIRSWNNTEDAIDTAGRSQPAKELAKAVDLIEESLDAKYWPDESHLVLQTGTKTFKLIAGSLDMSAPTVR